MLSKVSEFLKKKSGEISEKGLWFAVKKTFRDHVFGVTQGILFRRDLSLPVKFKKMVVKGATVSFITDEGVKEILYKAHPENAKIYDAHLAEGCTAAIIHIGDKLVGQNWYAFKDIYDGEYYNQLIKVNESEMYQFGALVEPEYLRSPATLQLLTYIYPIFHEKGYKYIYSIGDLPNTVSIKMHFKMGYEETGRCLNLYKLFRWRWSHWRTYENPYRPQFIRGEA